MPSKKKNVRKLVPCSRSQVRNPLTNRCKRVSKTSSRKVLKRKVSKKASPARKLVPCSRSQVRNPLTNRCIKRVSKKSPVKRKVSRRKVSNKKTSVGKWKLLSFKDAPKLIGKKIYLLHEQHQEGRGEPSIIKGYCEPYGECSVVSSKRKNIYDSLAIIDSHNKNASTDYSFSLDTANKYYVSGSDWVKYKL
jgi:hypothetical protein